MCLKLAEPKSAFALLGGAKLDAIKAFKLTGDLPQNVNYAVKANYALALLETIADAADKLPAPNKAVIPSSEIAKRVESASVLVLVWE